MCLRLSRVGISISALTRAFRRLEEDSELRHAFVRTCTTKGLDADSPYAEKVCELFESYGWKWRLEER